MPFEKLTNTDREEVLAFLLKAPEMNVVLLHNLGKFGLDRGDSPFNADYMGRRGGAGLEAVGALYNLGTLFFRADGPRAVRGMADYIVRLGRMPFYTAGTRSHLRVFLEELAGEAPSGLQVKDSRFLVLRRGKRTPAEKSGARPATAADLETLMRMQAEFEREVFGKNVAEEEGSRRVLEHQVSQGAAMVVEEDGRIVSKAEATVAEPWSALVGGVFTDPEARGRGLSTRCLSALCEVLLDRVPAVGLNVFDDNHPALRVYEKTGFEVAEQWLTVEMA